MKCKYRKQCNHYGLNNYTRNTSIEKEYCGMFRKFEMDKKNYFKNLKVLFSIFIFGIFIISFIGIVSADMKFDNAKNVDSKTNSITIKNFFGLGSSIGTVTLLTNQVNYVIPGRNRKVMIFNINSAENYPDAIGKMKIKNLNTGQEEEKFYYFEYAVYEDVLVDDFKDICVEKTDGTTWCSREKIGSHIENKIVGWKKLDNNNLPKEKTTLALVTDVKEGDTYDGIPNFFGVDLNEWAVWTDGLNTNLSAYYSFDNSHQLDNIIDNSYNFYTVGTPVNNATNCLFGNCWKNFTQNDLIRGTTPSIFSLTDDKYFTMNMWIYKYAPVSIGGDIRTTPIIESTTTVGTNSWTLYGGLDTGISPSGMIGFRSGTTYIFNYNTIENIKTEYMITVIHNSSGLFLYKNATLDSEALGVTTNFGTATSIDVGAFFDITGGGHPGTFNGTVDELGLWIDRGLTEAELSQLYNDGSGIQYGQTIFSNITLNSPTDGETFFTSSIPFNCTARSDINISNMTLFIDGVLNYTKTINGQTNVSELDINVNLLLGTHNATCSETDINNGKSNSTTNTFNLVKTFIENSQTYNSNTTMGAYETFQINISYSSTQWSGIVSYLQYNNTNYTANVLNVGDNIVFSTSLFIPTVKSTTVKNFTWLIGFVSANGSIEYTNSSWKSQTVNVFFVDNCSSFSNKVFNLSLEDEDNFNPLNGTIDLSIQLYTYGTNHPITIYNNSLLYFSGKSTEVCLSNMSSNYTVGYTMKYQSNSSYFIQYKTIQRLNVYQNIEQNVILYNLLTSRGNTFQINLAGISNNQNLLIDAQRQYLASDNFLSVESSVTDSNGNAAFHLVPETEIYNFIVSRDGVVLASFNNYKVKCANVLIGDCSIILNLYTPTASINDFSNYGNITQVYLWNNLTRTLLFTFISTDGNVHNVSQEVSQNHQYTGTSLICSTMVIGTSGTITCNVPENYGNDTLISKVIVDGVLVGTKFITISAVPDFFAGVKNILAIFLYSTLTLLFLSHPIFLVIGSILGVILSACLLLVGGTSGVNVVEVIGFFIAAGIIIAWQIGRRQ